MEKQEKEELKDLYAQSFPTLKEGEIIKGRIIRRVGSVVLVDMGLKSEGILPLDEFNSLDDVIEGKEILVYLESLEDKEGFPVISKKKADFQLAWDTIQQKAESAEGVPAIIKKKVKGGLAVEVLGLDAFLPGSQIDMRPVNNLDSLIGKTFDVKILSVNWFKKNIVVSRRTLLEEQAKRARAEAFARINVGDIVEGTVKTITDFGAFVDIGGIDALLHISDMAWNKVVHPKEFVNVGEKINVKVISADPDTGRVTIGLKQLTPHPWDGIEEKYPIGSRVKGRVTTLAEYGAFVELEKGVEGLIHVSEMSWTKLIHHPSQILKIGETIETVVLSIDKENRRISLGLKQTTPDPWSLIDEKYHVGQKVNGRIRSLKDFGAFVEIEEGIEGLIHNGDLSWTKKVKHPREVVKKGQKIETIILDIEKENRRISLGLKQTKEDPFYRFSKEYKDGDTVKARIIDLPKPGIVVNLPQSIEGFVPISHLARGGRKTKDKYKIGEEIELVISKIDLERRHIALSEKMLFKPEEEEKKPKRRGRAKEPSYETEEETDRFTLEDHLK
ncbi:MAG: 30S ribosomal protein S1 [bacterium]|nr:30S ribosomal protein S1 [candidate division WOR-3 bacterium]MDH5683502.1 30S ribosomal protein S1 [candidate division WOR-3 bacterium]